MSRHYLYSLRMRPQWSEEEQQQTLVARLEKELCGGFCFNATRKDYKNHAERISCL